MKIYTIIFAVFMASSSLAKHLVEYSNENLKIVGGEDAEQGQFPYQVSLYLSESSDPQSICGGTIFSETVIVTAAHCCKVFEDTIYDVTWFEVIAGDLILSDNSGLEQRSKIKDYLIHPDYTTNPPTNDICLLYLETELEFNDNVKYIALEVEDPEPGTMCDISGWGLLEFGGDSAPDHLQWANVTIDANQVCQEQYPSLVPGVMICAGGNGKDTCQGDSGGPLVCDDFLVGVTSFGKGCGDYPGVYTRVSAFWEWVWDNEDPPTTSSTTTSATTTTPTTTSTTTTTPTTTSTTTPTTMSTTTPSTPTTKPTTTHTTTPITTPSTTTSMSSVQIECSFFCMSFALMMFILGILN